MATQRAKQANQRSRTSPSWWQYHARAVREAGAQVRRNLISTCVSVLVIGIALGLPVTVLVFLDQQSEWLEQWGSEPSLSVFLKRAVDLPRANQLAANWQNDRDIKQTRVITAAEAFATIGLQAGLTDIAGPVNPLPHVVVVIPHSAPWDSLGADGLKARFAEPTEVDSVILDFLWVERLRLLMQFAERAVLIIGLLLAIGSVLVVGMAVRNLLQSGEDEIEVLKLVGATDSYVRRPFLYSGICYGLAAGILGAALMYLVFISLADPFNALTRHYNGLVALGIPTTAHILLLLAGGIAVGWCGAWLGTGTYLRQFDRFD